MRKLCALSLILCCSLAFSACERSPHANTPPGSLATSAFATTAVLLPSESPAASSVAPIPTTPLASLTATASATPSPAATPAATAPLPTPRPGEKLTGNDYYVVERNQRQGVVDKYGRTVLPCEFAKVNILSYYHNDPAQGTYKAEGPVLFFAIPVKVKLKPEKIIYEGYILDAKGKRLTEGTYQSAYVANENLITVFAYNDGIGGSGAVDCTGRLVIPCKYSQVAPMGDYIAAFTNQGSTVDFYDKAGTLFKSASVTNASIYGKYITAQDITGGFGLLDGNLKWVMAPLWTKIQEVSDDRFIVTKGDQSAIMDLKGTVIIPFFAGYFDCSWEPVNPEQMFFMAQSPAGIALYDYYGKLLFQSDLFFILRYYNGVFMEGTEKESILVDKTGKVLLPGVSNLQDWLPKQQLFVSNDYMGHQAFYKPDGTKLPLPNAYNIDCLTAERFLVRVDDFHFGICDSGGNWVVKPEYSYMSLNGEADVKFSVGIYPNKQFGIMDFNGKVLLPAKYDYIYSGNGNGDLLNARVGDISGLIDSNGKWIWYTSDYDTLMD